MANASGKTVEMTPEQVVEWRATVIPVLERLCRLQERVNQHIGHDTSNDCFCGYGGFWPRADAYRSEQTSIDFIEAAVQEKIERESSVSRKGVDHD